MEALRAFPGVEVFESDPQAPLQRDFEILIAQPFDHLEPEKGGFVQRLFLSHIRADKPMVVVTEGYQISGYSRYELTNLLDGNQLRIEHRFTGESLPDTIPWEFLTVEQAAADHHKIISLFKQIYSGKWLSTGISKGGQTALFHRYFYPDDVDATVAYVAPMPTALEDQRLNNFLSEVGSEECRQKIRDFQRVLLKNRAEILPLLRKWARENNESFSIGLDSTLEYAVLEFPFSHWQSTPGNCLNLPDSTASISEIFNHFQETVPFGLYSDEGIARYQSSFYQFCTQLGYYGFVTEHLSDLLQTVPEPNNLIFAPPQALDKYDPSTVNAVLKWLQTKGNNILYIYGGQDTWYGAGVELIDGQTNALKMVLEEGWHNTRIKHFSTSDQFLIYDSLQAWMDMPVGPRRDAFAWGMVAASSLFFMSMLLGVLWLILRRKA